MFSCLLGIVVQYQKMDMLLKIKYVNSNKFTVKRASLLCLCEFIV